MLRIKTLIIFCLFSLSCGIKGKPSPPLDPPWIGHGEVRRDQNKNHKSSPQEDQINGTNKETTSEPAVVSPPAPGPDSTKKEQNKTKKKKND